MIPLYESISLVLPNIEEMFTMPIRKSLQYYKDMQAIPERLAKSAIKL